MAKESCFLREEGYDEKTTILALHHCKSYDTMETSYACTFPKTFKMMNVFLVLPIGTASVERSFCHLKMILKRLCSHLSDCSVAQLMRISIEGPEIDAVEFEEILEISKEHNHRIYFDCVD